MRVAFIAPYQGPEILVRRPMVQNLSLAGNVKIELIAGLLHKAGHQVEVISQGEVVEHRLRLYEAWTEVVGSSIRVHYGSALPVRFLNGFWSGWRTLSIFKRRHQAAPFDLVILYNLKWPQVICGRYAQRNLRLPLVLEYEDDAFVGIHGRVDAGWTVRHQLDAARSVMKLVSGGIGASPHLLSRMPSSIPKLLLRGVVSEDILAAGEIPGNSRRNWVVYSGTHFRSKGLEQLITAWKQVRPAGWELHFTGHGELTPLLESMARGDDTIVFHGLVDNQERARILGLAKIGINPHDVSDTPGNVFAFKIIEYLAAGMHVMTTPMGKLEPELEIGVSYLTGNAPDTQAAALKQIVESRGYERTATAAAQNAAGPSAVGKLLERFVGEVAAAHASRVH